MDKTPNEALGRLSPSAFKAAGKTPIIIVLDNVRSALNVGSVFRTADAFIIEKIILCGITATPPNKDILKSALGATDTVDWQYHAQTIGAVLELKQQGYKLVSVEQTKGAIMLHQYSIHPQEKTALVFGHEVHGVNQEIINLSDACIEVPQAGTKHSLNIAVCSGIVVWHFFAAMHYHSTQ